MINNYMKKALLMHSLLLEYNFFFFFTDRLTIAIRFPLINIYTSKYRSILLWYVAGKLFI